MEEEKELGKGKNEGGIVLNNSSISPRIEEGGGGGEGEGVEPEWDDFRMRECTCAHAC